MDITVEYSAEDAVEELTDLYGTHYLFEDRTEAELRTALEQTDEIVVLRDRQSGSIIASARVLTDYVYFTRVYDVIVHETYRGEGVGKRLLEAVVRHPNLSEVSTMSLACRQGLVPFYESCGFEPCDTNVELPDGSSERLRQLAYHKE